MALVRGWRQWEAPTNDHTPEFGLLGVDAPARVRIIQEVLADAKSLVLPRLAEDGTLFTTLVQATRGLRRWNLVQPMNVSLVTDTSATLEEYRAGLSPKVRSEVGRLRRKAEREHELKLMPLERPSDLDAQLTRAFALEASGWKGRKGTAIISSPDTEQFYRQIADDFHAAGTLRISELVLDGSVAAVAFSIIHQRRVFTLKVAYDERHRRLGPGFVLLMAMIERCFELGVAAYEFSGPDAEYERRFATSEQAYRRLRIYRPDPINAARYVYHRALRPALRAGYHRAQRVSASRS
jgi:CelD/BcsL family acetyltransferase involved in cellulose biosynthesis